MKKKLIVSGCSFTDKNFYSQSEPNYDCSFPKWPELLAVKLDMDCINLGACGAGNHYIYSTLLEEIIRTPKEEIGLVIPAWSQVQRDDWEKYGQFTPKAFSYRDNYNNDMIWRNARLGKDGNVFYWMLDHLRRIVSFDSLCKSHDIPYKQVSMLSPYSAWLSGLMRTDFEIVENLDNPDFIKRYDYVPTLLPTTAEIKQWFGSDLTITDWMLAMKDRKWLLKKIFDYGKYIDTENFIGWPMVAELGGYPIEEKVLMSYDEDGIQKNEMNLIIGGYDYHPNDKGHKEIAEYLHGQLV